MIVQSKIFSIEECNRIINMSKENQQNWFKNDRNYESESIFHNNENDWIFKKLINFFLDNIKIKLIDFNKTIHFHKYYQNNLFTKHVDNNSNRKYIIGVILNENYKGGHLKVYGDEEIVINKVIGNTFLFDTSLYHEVTKIDYGIRYTIIWFIHSNELIYEKQRLF